MQTLNVQRGFRRRRSACCVCWEWIEPGPYVRRPAPQMIAPGFVRVLRSYYRRDRRSIEDGGSMETTFFEKHAQNALIGAIITSILALLTGIVSIWLTVHFNDLAQVRQLRLEQITKFDQSGQQIVEAASAFIVAINDKDSKALGSARLKLNAVLAGQAHDTENIARFFDQQAKKKAKDYQSALEELSPTNE